MPLDNISELKRRVPGGKYTLARAVAERARQLQSGATPLVTVRTPNPLSVAIDEIVQGKVSFQVGAEAQQGEDQESQTAGETNEESPAQDTSTDQLLS
jgi:DNA-directed RNA polymerase subunit omega